MVLKKMIDNFCQMERLGEFKVFREDRGMYVVKEKVRTATGSTEWFFDHECDSNFDTFDEALAEKEKLEKESDTYCGPLDDEGFPEE